MRRALAVTGRTDEALSLFNKRPLLNEHGVGYVVCRHGPACRSGKDRGAERSLSEPASVDLCGSGRQGPRV